jgi:hypothetical protein
MSLIPMTAAPELELPLLNGEGLVLMIGQAISPA